MAGISPTSGSNHVDVSTSSGDGYVVDFNQLGPTRF